MTEMDLSTIVTTYVCTVLSLILIFARLDFRYRRMGRVRVDDIWMAVSVVPLVIRLGVVHIVLVYGTNSFDRTGNPVEKMDLREFRQRIVASKMILAGRIVYAGFVWCMKVCILGFYERLTARSRPYGVLIDATYVVVFLTYLAVICSTLLECRPFPKYWQMTPDPGYCVHAPAQLVTMGSFNILTDMALILIPLPLVLKSRLPLFRKLQLSFLFGLGMFVVCITIIRMPIIIGNNSMQKARSLWASIECLAACIVANAPDLNSCFRRKPKKHDAEAYNLPANSRRRRMPVMGQDSVGSLTRNDGSGGLNSIIEARTEVVQKIDIHPLGSGHSSKATPPPWQGDFLGTQIWTG